MHPLPIILGYHAPLPIILGYHVPPAHYPRISCTPAIILGYHAPLPIIMHPLHIILGYHAPPPHYPRISCTPCILSCTPSGAHYVASSLVPRPRPAFSGLPYGNGEATRGVWGMLPQKSFELPRSILGATLGHTVALNWTTSTMPLLRICVRAA